MGRKKIGFSNKEFEELYRKWRGGTITQRAMWERLGVSKPTLLRRIKEYESRDPEEEIISRVFREGAKYKPNTKQVSDGLDMLTAIRDKAVAAVFFDPQYRTNMDYLDYGNEGVRMKGRIELSQMNDEQIITFYQAN